MKHRQKYLPRSVRARRGALLRIGVWIFIAIFGFSVAGALLVGAIGTVGH